MSVKVFDLLTATPAPVSGKPTPTRTFQWLRNGTAISGANAQTYTLQLADEGALVSVRQIETNVVGKATATSATVGPVEEAPPVQATGGIETVINPSAGEFYRVHTFLESGDLTVTQGGEVDIVVVGGGGSGGTYDNQFGAGSGGGAGGLVEVLGLSISEGQETISIGDGGGARPTANRAGNNGQSSSAFGLIALGGGAGGGRSSTESPESGGSGGGASRSGEEGDGLQPSEPGLSGQFGFGNRGGKGLDPIDDTRSGAGGGGAGGPGGDIVDIGLESLPTEGGPGRDVSGLFGLGVGDNGFLAGGGGGGARRSLQIADGGIGGGGAGGDENTPGQNAAPNTGGGGGGASGEALPSGAGGSGIVIVRYPITEAEHNAEVA